MRLLISMAILMVVAGCMVGPHYHPPDDHSPGQFSEMNPTVNTNEPVAEWWKEFHDAELNRLVALTLQSNLDLAVAEMRIRESRLQRNITAADLFPQVDANGSYTDSRGSKNVVLPLGGSGGGASGGGSKAGATSSGSKTSRMAANPASSPGGQSYGANPLGSTPSPFGQGGLPGQTTELYQVGFDATWELDVFGGQRRAVEAATGELAMAAAARHAVQISLAAETARDCLQIRGTQERLRIARENLGVQSNVLALAQSKASTGLGNDLDVLQADAEVSATLSTLAPLDAAIHQSEHALSTLLGREPGALSAELAAVRPVPTRPPQVPVGLPSELVRRRPDIQQAERAIAVATARIGQAQADLYPKFALIGTTGLDASAPEKLFNWDSRYFLISPTVAWRIFDAGRIFSNIRLQESNQTEAVLQYRSTILKALQEVEDALIGYAAEQVRHNHLAAEYQKDQQALELARQRYDQGITDFLAVLDAERSVLAANDQLAASDTALAIDLVALYKALGGGWK